MEEKKKPSALVRLRSYLYCCGLSVGLQLPLLLTCSTVELTSSWPTCSMLRLAADGGVSREGLFSRDRLLSARAAYARRKTRVYFKKQIEIRQKFKKAR